MLMLMPVHVARAQGGRPRADQRDSATTVRNAFCDAVYEASTAELGTGVLWLLNSDEGPSAT